MEKTKEQELLKSVADVLDEALAVYDELQKADSFANIENVDDMKGEAKGIVGEGVGTKPAMAKEDPEHEELEAPEHEEEEHEDEDKDSDEKLAAAYKSLVAKMEKRGLMHKSEADHDLRKSVDERFDALNKAVREVSETVKKIAAQPSRKGVSGFAPLKKSEGEEQSSLKKSEVIEKLFELRKSGDKRVDSLLINRIETNRHSAADVQTLRALNILK